MDQQIGSYKLVYGDVSQECTRYILEHKPVVGIDIETDGLNWRGNVGLVSLAVDGYGIELVHKPERTMHNLDSICVNPDIRKIFHHAPFDMRFLMAYAHIRFQRVLCTRIAAYSLDPSRTFSHKLGSLIEQFLGVTVEKDQALSNWFVNELSPDQIRYAVNDVFYLSPLLSVLMGNLAARAMLKPYKDACDYLPSKCYYELLGITDIYGR